MTKDEKAIVLTVRQALAERLGPERYETWFGRTTELRLASDTLTVATDRRFRADFIRGNFRGELEQITARVCSRSISVEVLVEPSLASLARIEASRPIRAAAQDQPAAAEAKSEAAETRSENGSPTLLAQATLPTYIVGKTNQVAAGSCQRVVDEPGVCTPLFLHGPTGVGKTHLLRGVHTAIRQRWPGKRIVYLTAEQFTSQFLDALHGRGLPAFRTRYRGLETLILDDLQFFAGKRATLVELFHTIDNLLRDHRQLVLAADRPLEDLQGLGRDLIARLQGGLTCSMQAADRETRLGVLRQMAVRQRIALPESVLEAAAECLPGDARQLAGAMHRLVATAAATGRDLDLSLAKGVFEDLCRASVRVVRLADIEKVVCEVFGLTPDILHSETKAKHASQPRMFAMWLARRYTRSGLSEIGAFFGRRSHSTVVSAQKKVDGLMADGATIRLADRMCRVDEAVLKLESQLRTG